MHTFSCQPYCSIHKLPRNFWFEMISHKWKHVTMSHRQLFGRKLLCPFKEDLEVEPGFLLHDLFFLFNIWLKPLHQIFDRQILSLVRSTVWVPRGDEHASGNLDNTILCNAVLDGDIIVAVDTYVNQSTPAGDIDAQAVVLKQGRELDVEDALRDCVFANIILLWAVESIGVQGLLDDDVVLEQGCEVLLTASGEQEGVDARAELLPCPVGGSEEGGTSVLMTVIVVVGKTGLY